ncbi:HAMP domain-containing histidine kinase [Flagellimonas sp. 389]|uniref:HAMP domain-containing sensor histidine kinase n=1 Tax=Flagellimonas sp. 389 TaxID=2835862 RepID=UPI001BD65543|nr:HAMP domain-containing sensor histidine kinase [Flagellimonas sp. 389]MBS9464121.1 HAMP domain-containing histidine kinase [Flagellimonas sp. 389]
MNTIRGRVLIAFFMLFILIGPFLLFAFNSLKKIDNAKSFRESIALFDGNRLKADNEFFHILDFDAKQDSFYIEKSTQSTEQYHHYITNAKKALNDIQIAKSNSNIIVDKRLGRISEDIDNLDSKIIEAITLIKKRGFKNFGVIGKMRQHIHKLETGTKGITLAEILQMRRREKDFFLRKDYVYAKELNSFINTILNRLESNAKADLETITSLKGYQKNFNQVVAFEKEIGDINTGLIKEIQTIHSQLNDKVSTLYSIVDSDSEVMIDTIKSYLVLFFSITVLFAILSAFIFSGHIANPIKNLISDMDSIVQNNFEGQIHKNRSIKIDEIDKLTGTYNGLVNKIRQQILSLSEKNKSLSSLNVKLVESENELKEASRIKDKFFSIISHDLRGHTGNVLSLANILNEDKGEMNDQEKEMFVKYLSDASQNLQLLLDNLLNWAKTQMNDHQISKRMFDINPVIEKNVTLFKENAHRKNIRIDYTATELSNVYADKNMIDFVIRNLLSNALKFTKSGDTITIAALEHGDHLEIQVNDTGIGMTEEQKEALLNSTKENSTTKGTDNEEGTGLGFAICKDFIKRNNGTVQIKSKINSGSMFSFTVPTKLTRESILRVS